MKTLTIVVGVMLVFVFVWERVDVVRLGYQIERLKTQKVLLERERDQLQVKFSVLTAPERIAKVAIGKIGAGSTAAGASADGPSAGRGSEPGTPTCAASPSGETCLNWEGERVTAGPSRGRRYVMLLLLLCGFSIILFRLVTLQVLQAAELTAKADRQHQKTVSFEGARGMVSDRHGKVLAMNVEVPSVFGVPTSLESPSIVARHLSPVLHIQSAELERKLRQDKSFVWLARKVEPEQGRRLELLSLEGIGVVMEGRRFYPKGPLLAHVLGFAGMDGQGLEGLERRYDSHLHGEKRVTVLQRDALGRTVFPKGLTEQVPTPGHALTLTVDEVIQYIAEKELEEAVTHTHAKSGTIIVMEPQSGAILAMAVSPRFDPNVVASLTPDRWRNRALTDTYEPGSTMKVVVAAAALEEKVMTPGSMVFGENGHMVIANTTIHDHEKLGWMTFSEVIQKSSNIGAAKTGIALGEQRFYRYLQAFGFGHVSGQRRRPRRQYRKTDLEDLHGSGSAKASREDLHGNRAVGPQRWCGVEHSHH